VVAARQERDTRAARRPRRREGPAGFEAIDREIGRHGGVALDLGRERVELEPDEQVLQAPVIGLGAAERRGVEIDRKVDRDLHELTRQLRVFPVRPQALADLPFDLVGALEERREAPVLSDPLLRRDRADTRYARNVVDAVAHQGEHIGHLPGRNAEERRDAGVVEEDLLAGVEHADAVAGDELQHVLVGGHDDDVVARDVGLLRERADHVVGLEAGQLEDGDPVRGQSLADLGEL